MAEMVERSRVGADAPAEAVQTGARKKIHSRQVLHTGIAFVLLLLYLWPGGMLVNSVEPRVLGLPLYVFWVVFLLPALSVANLLVYARYMVARERQLQEQGVEPWE
jgi:hypothetical protein